MIAAALANLGHGGDRRSDATKTSQDVLKPTRESDGDDRQNVVWVTVSPPPVSQGQAAEVLDVSVASVSRAAKVLKDGTEELADAVRNGKLDVATAAKLTALPDREQKEIATAADPPAVARKRLKTNRLHTTPEPDPTPDPVRARLTAAARLLGLAISELTAVGADAIGGAGPAAASARRAAESLADLYLLTGWRNEIHHDRPARQQTPLLSWVRRVVRSVLGEVDLHEGDVAKIDALGRLLREFEQIDAGHEVTDDDLDGPAEPTPGPWEGNGHAS
jgi:hypothetical protein